MPSLNSPQGRLGWCSYGYLCLFLLGLSDCTLAQAPTTKSIIPIRANQLNTRPASANHLLDQLSAAMTAERYQEAHALATELHQRWPDQDEYTALWLDSQAISAERHEQTLNALLRLRQSRLDSAAIVFALGRQYARLGQWADAQSAFQSAHALSPNHPDPIYNLAVCWEQLGQTVLAQHFYQRVLDLLNTPTQATTPITTLSRARVQSQRDRLPPAGAQPVTASQSTPH